MGIITATNLTSAVQSPGPGASFFITASISPTANDLILLAVMNMDSNTPPATPTVTGAGMTWTQVATVAGNTTEYTRVTLFRTLSASPGSGVLTIDFGGVTQNRCGWSVDDFGKIDVSGTNGSGAIAQTANNTLASGTALTVTLGTFLNANNAAYGAIGVANNLVISTGAGFSQLSQTATGILTENVEWQNSNNTSVSWSWSGNNHAAALAVEIKALISGAGLFMQL